MNTETREIRASDDIPREQKESGTWIQVRRKYVQRQPISDADFARILAAEERRKRRSARRTQP